MSKKYITIGAVALILLLGAALYFFKFHQISPSLSSEVNYEQVAIKFISENDPAFIEDGFDLKLVSKETLADKNIKMTFFYKMYSYPEGDDFRADVIVNTENGSAQFAKE